MASFQQKIEDAGPYVELGVALFFGVGFLVATGFTLETTESWINRGTGTGISLSWSPFVQLPDALQGKYADHQLVAILVAWGVVAAYILFNSIKQLVSNGLIEKTTGTICMFLIGVDTYANYQYLGYTAWYWQWLISGVFAWIIMSWGKIALNYFRLAISNF